MKRTQQLRIGIQGIATSFHHLAALRFFGNKISIRECLTFQALCDDLQDEECDFAVMAIENSIAGSILPNYFLLQQYHFSIIGELYLPIYMHLLALPGVKVEQIKTIESHPMAIRQCSEYLHRFTGVSIRESDDTAVSARRIRDEKLNDVAAIANEFAAKKFKLKILDKCIETHKKNFTRFLVLSKKATLSSVSNKASLCFEVANEVGSLVDALLSFKTNRINLSKIQSIPIIGRPSEYSVHVDVEWSKRSHYDKALQEVIRQVKNLTVLGEYRKAIIEFK